MNKYFSQSAKANRIEASRPENIKGGFKGICNRGACDATPALWYNTVMQKHYCDSCARRINESATNTTYHDGTNMKPFVHLDQRIEAMIKEEQAKCEECKGEKTETDCLSHKMIRLDFEHFGELL